MPPDEPNDEEKIEELPEDLGTPFQSSDETPEARVLDADAIHPDQGKLSSTHPATDTNIQLEELYDEGVSGAAEAGEPNVEDEVIGYTPRRDNVSVRRQHPKRRAM